MAANALDLMSLLCLDPKFSLSPFGGNHRTVLIERDFSNSSDFVLNSLLHHLGRREPNTQILLITLSHDWIHYSACAAKCGFNLRKRQSMGNVDVLDIMERYLDDLCKGAQTNYCDLILEEVKKFIETQSIGMQQSNQKMDDSAPRPIAILFDDLSLLSLLGAEHSEIYRLVTAIDSIMRHKSKQLQTGRLSHLIVQTLFTNVKRKQTHIPSDDDLNFLVANLSNMCDICLTLRRLETGHSTRVDGTIKIQDKRLPVITKTDPSASERPSAHPSLSMFGGSVADIGSEKAYYYKLSDRRVRLTSSALI